MVYSLLPLYCDGCEYGDWIGTSSFSIGQRSYQYIDVDIYQTNDDSQIVHENLKVFF